MTQNDRFPSMLMPAFPDSQVELEDRVEALAGLDIILSLVDRSQESLEFEPLFHV